MSCVTRLILYQKYSVIYPGREPLRAAWHIVGVCDSSGRRVARGCALKLLRQMRVGLVGALVAVIAAGAITTLSGPLFGVYDWRSVAAGIMIAEVLAWAALLEFIRPPNPYSRVYALYDLRDLGPTGELQSSDLRGFWNAVPLLAGALLLVLTRRWM